MFDNKVLSKTMEGVQFSAALFDSNTDFLFNSNIDFLCLTSHGIVLKCFVDRV